MGKLANSVQLLIFDRAGWKIAEMEADLQSVSWRLGQTGRVKFGVDYGNPAATIENLRPGNRVMVQFANGLPDWGGVLDVPRSRVSTGLGLTAYEADWQLGWRVTGVDEQFATTSPGGIVSTLLGNANGVAATGVAMGDTYTGGAQGREYHYDGLLSAVRGLAAGYDYAVVPKHQAGRLSFLLHWYQRRGRDLRGSVLLAEGHNVGTVTLDEQGPLYNRVIAVGGGTTWAERPIEQANDLDSQYFYGLREYVIMQSSITDEATLQELAQAALDEGKHPRVRGTLNGVVNRNPSPFADYDIGDIVTLQAFLARGAWAFDEPVRVLAREWSPEGVCTVEVEQWRD